MQSEMPMVLIAQKIVEVPQLQIIDKVVDIPVDAQRQVSMVQTVQQNPVEYSTVAGLGQGCLLARCYAM